MQYINDRAFAASMDRMDMLKEYRELFHIPQFNGRDAIYFTGNSLGLQPKKVREYVEQELKDWSEMGVEGHMHGKNPWFYYHHFLESQTAAIAGAMPLEVVVMNSLTVNLNLLMISFYRPVKTRYKVMMEYMAFPSDQYAVENQVRLHGYDPAEAIIELMPRTGEYTLRKEDILDAIEKKKNDLALIMIGGVNYYTGQLFDMEGITAHAKKCSAEIMVGFDLAHAAGNVTLQLHDWNVDFATWCSYKYLNSGPGGTSGVFVHERHCHNAQLPRLSGWWGNEEKTRFQMKKGFHPQAGAAGWQMSNAQILPMAVHRASLEIFEKAGMLKLRDKSILLTGYLEFLLKEKEQKDYTIITPAEKSERGCQLSILMGDNGKEVFNRLTNAGVIADWREPNVIRIAPVPLYNSFEDVFRFAEIFNA